MFAGSSLNDDIYHTVVFKRRGTKLTVTVDEDDPILGICHIFAIRLSFFGLFKVFDFIFVSMNLKHFIQAEISTGQTTLSFSKLYFGGIEGGEIIPSTAPGLRGSMSQVYFNGQKFFELSRAGQLDARLKEKRDAKLG